MGNSPARRLEAARAKYPALGPPEILIWREWLRLHEMEFAPLPQFWLDYRATTPPPQPLPGDIFDYNVRIGQGRDPGKDFDQSVRDQWIAKTQYRIDALGFDGNTPVLFEVDKNISTPQVGQLLGYLAVWRASGLPGSDPRGVLVTANFNANAMHLVKEAGLGLVTVSVDFRVLSPYSQTPIAGTE